MIKLKHITVKRKGYYFTRAIPNHLQSIAGKQFFVIPLHLPVIGTRETELQQHRLDALGRYELYIKTLEQSDPSYYTEEEVIKLATEYVKTRGLDDLLQTHKYQKDPEVLSDLIPDIDYVDIDNPTIDDRVIITAYKALQDSDILTRRTLETLYDDYLYKNGYVDSDGNTTPGKARDLPRVSKRWSMFLSIMGNQQLSPGLVDSIHRALDKYSEKRLNKVAPSSVERELNTIMSILNNGNRRYRLNWNIVRTELPKHRPKEKVVLTQEDQRELVSNCLSDTDTPILSCCILLLLQGGMMASEIKRLTPDKINLNSELPYIIVDSETKTDNRKRIVPIVLGVNFITQHIQEAIQWLCNTTDSNHSRMIAKVMKMHTTRDDKLTAHCLRHSFRNNAIANGADLGKASLIAGWSSAGGVSNQMLRYGSQGLESSDVVKGLYETSKQIHRHLVLL